MMSIFTAILPVSGFQAYSISPNRSIVLNDSVEMCNNKFPDNLPKQIQEVEQISETNTTVSISPKINEIRIGGNFIPQINDVSPTNDILTNASPKVNKLKRSGDISPKTNCNVNNENINKCRRNFDTVNKVNESSFDNHLFRKINDITSPVSSTDSINSSIMSNKFTISSNEENVSPGQQTSSEESEDVNSINRYNLAKNQLYISVENIYQSFEQDMKTGSIIWYSHQNVSTKLDHLISKFISNDSNVYLIYFAALVHNNNNNKYIKFEFIYFLNGNEQRFSVYVIPSRKKDFKKLISNVHYLYNNTIKLIYGNSPKNLFISKIK